MSYPNHLTKFSNEPYKHFMAKACLFWILRKLKHEIASEWLIGDRYVDIYDKTTHTLYEIEINKSPKFRSLKHNLYQMTGYEVIIIDCSNISSNINKIQKYLSKFIVLD